MVLVILYFKWSCFSLAHISLLDGENLYESIFSVLDADQKPSRWFQCS